MKIKRKTAVLSVILALTAGLFFVFFMAQEKSDRVEAAEISVSAKASYTAELTGGTVRYYDSDKVNRTRPYKDLGSGTYDSYRRRASFSLTSSIEPKQASEATMYIKSGTFTIKYEFSASLNDDIGKSWVSTRSHSLDLKNASGQTVSTSKTGGISNDGSGSITNSYTSLADGAYTISSHFWQGHGIHSTQYVDDFYYTQKLIVDTKSPTFECETDASKTSVAAAFSHSASESPITATYSHNGISKGSYLSDTVLTSEGKYVITATDAAGNTASKTLYVDKTAPVITAPTAASKTNVSASWQAGSNESPITATYTYNGDSKGVYERNTKLTGEGKYVITATDAAGNTATKTLYVDRTAPVLTAASTVSNKSLSATYSAAGKNESPISVTYTHNGIDKGEYRSGRSLSDEGKYVITATDQAGNSASVTLYVDKTAPELTRSFEYGKNNGTVSWSVGSFETDITAVYSFVGSSGTRTNAAYLSGQSLTDEGAYTVTATDEAGNCSEIKITVDRTAPTLTFADDTTGAAQITRESSSVAWRVENYESPVTVTYSFRSEDSATAPDIDDAPYVSGSAIAAEGSYTFTATDRAGNTAHASVIIDKTSPSIAFLANGKAFERYVNSAFTAQGGDSLSGVDKIELYEAGRYVPYDYAPREKNGEYLFRVTDKAGNVTSKTATVFETDTFGNLASIRDSFKLNAWYVVTLPARIFTTPNNDVAGRYSFESYDKALDFAAAKEREFRVTKVQGGYMYVSATNEAVAQKYDTESSLVAAVQKYAKGYISARQMASSNGNDRYFTEPESLTRNSPILPDHLLDLKDLPRYFARSTATWSLPSVAYISAMPYAVTARYLGDFEEDKTQKEIVIARGTSLKDIEDYRQGWYLISERDEAGNVEKYLVYSDAELPTVRAHAEKGDGENDVVLDYEYAKNETLYFLSLSFEALLDNADTYITLKLEKGNTVRYFTQSDELPTLGSDEYTSGKYTVTVYDRSLNALIFDVYIAGAAPTMTHGSLAADKPDCKISFVTSDRYNVITGITLFKIEYDGSKTVLDTDGLGTSITVATLSYTLTVGGKYGATLTDNYRRTVEIPPIFFLKGLPSGTLSGVKDGGRTNRNVSFTFDSADVAELYVLLPGGERRIFTDYAVQTGSAQTTYNITAGEDTSHEYLVFLHNAQDLSLFVEYTFEIDTILPTFEIKDSDGNVIQPDGATNKSFSIKWSETGVSMRYYTARSGSLSTTKYNMNAVLSQGTLYYFTIKDDVGNELSFTVLLDNAVDYTVGGKYNAADGALYANKPITFTVNEPTVRFDVFNADGYTIDNGGTLTQAGRYEITVTDNYRNTVNLVIVLDFTPPVLTLDGAANGESVKNDVVVTADDFDRLYLTDRAGNKIRDVENGETFSASGSYYITASDYAGNAVTVSFSIDLSVDYALSVPSGGVTTSFVTLDSAEPLTIDVIKDGAGIESATRFTEPGAYSLTLTDGIGNSVSCVFVILPTRMRSVELALPIGTRIMTVMLGGNVVEIEHADKLALDTTGFYTVTLDCGGETSEFEIEIDNTPPEVTLTKDGKAVKVAGVDKDNVSLALTLDGKEISCIVGKSFDEPGHYVLTVTDELGNENVYAWDIPFRLNTWAIVAIVVGAVALVVVLVLIIRARRKPRMK